MSALSDLLKNKGKSNTPSKPVANLPSKKGSALSSLLKSKGKQSVNTDPNTRNLSQLLGGGTYKLKAGDPNANIKSERSTYGGLPTKTGYERADIFPVSLSGVNETPENITYEKFLPDVARKQALGEELPVIKTATDRYLIEEILPKYKSGEMSLREAQVKSVSYLRNEKEGLNKAMSKMDKGGIFGEFADDFVNTANKIGNFLGRKVGDIANKVVKDFGAEGRAEAEAKQKQMAQTMKETQEKKKTSLEQLSKLPVQKRIAISDPSIIRRAKAASEVLGYEIKPENLQEVYSKLSPEDKRVVDTASDVATIEPIAKTVTAPVRFTAGSLASAGISYGLEKANSDLQFTPKTDAEKLLIGEQKIQRLSKSDDLYGTIAQSAGIPAAMVAIAIIENPFLAGTGVNALLKNEIKRLGAKELSKLGTTGILKLTDDIIKAEVKAGKLEAKVGQEALTELAVKVATDIPESALKPPVSPKIASSETKPKKTSILPPKTKTIKSEQVLEKPEFSGKQISKEAKQLGSDQGGLSDYTLKKIKSEDYKTKTVTIKELRKKDPDLDEYLKSGEIREYEGEEFAMRPIVSSKGDVLDGYNRIAQRLKNGDTKIDVLIGIEKTSKKAVKFKDKILDPLQVEAKKYKTADDFVNSFEVGYRGRDKKFGGAMTPQKGTDTLYFSAEEEVAREYGDDIAKKFIDKSNIAEYGDRFNLIEEYIEKEMSERADEFTKFYNDYMGTPEDAFLDFMGKMPKGKYDMYAEADKILIPYLKKQGFDGFKFESQTFNVPEFAIFDPKKLFDEKDLRNIWNKANKSKSFTNIPKRDIIEVKGLAKKAMELTKKNDGVTINLKGDIPTTGYVYSPSKTTEKIISVKALKTKDIEDYILEHYEELLDSKNHFGNWKNGDDFVMDISRVEKDLNKASIGAKAADQDGIFNLDNFETINRKDYEKFANNAKVKNARLPRKTDVKKGASKGLSGAGKKSTPVEGDKSRLTLPKKPVVKREPIEKPVDLRRKIKREKLIAEQSTPKKIQADAIEKGLIDMYKDIPEYDKMNMKDQAKKVFKLIDEDYDRAVRIALGKELPKDDVLPESVLIGVKNQALKDRDTDLLIRLATDEEGVAKGTTLLGQRIKALDEGMENDAFRNIRRVVENRKKNMTDKGAKEVKNIRAKAKEIIEEAKPSKYDWQKLVDEITCPK